MGSVVLKMVTCGHLPCLLEVMDSVGGFCVHKTSICDTNVCVWIRHKPIS